MSSSQPALSQVTLSGQVGAAIGNHGPTAAGVQRSPGLAIGIFAEYGLTPSISTYIGHTRASFNCEEGFCLDNPLEFTSQGVSAGVLVKPLSFLLFRAGVIRNSVVVSSSDASAGLGYEMGGGALIRLQQRWELRPEVVFRSHSGVTGGVEGSTNLVAASIGVAFHLGGRR